MIGSAHETHPLFADRPELDALAFAVVFALHKQVPTDKRPTIWSDFTEAQVLRAKEAAALVYDAGLKVFENRLSTRLNNYLCEMKSNYDDSIVGFNEAWDVVRALFKEMHVPVKEPVPDLEGWNKVGHGTPLHTVLETKKAGEDGTNYCVASIASIGDEVEWSEAQGDGRTTVTHHSFAAPDYWRPTKIDFVL